MRALEKYSRVFELGFQTALEYRVNFLLSLLSAAYPIFIQSFLWTAIYRNSAEGVVYGYTYRQIMIYTFLAGLVARIVRTGFEYDIMEDIKNGKFSTFLVQPVHYFPYRLFSYVGQKITRSGNDSGDYGFPVIGIEHFLGILAGTAANPGVFAHVGVCNGLEFCHFLLL